MLHTLTMKKLRRKQKCGSDEDEVDSCVGIRIDWDKKNLAKQPESVLKVDCVNDTESEHVQRRTSIQKIY